MFGVTNGLILLYLFNAKNMNYNIKFKFLRIITLLKTACLVIENKKEHVKIDDSLTTLSRNLLFESYFKVKFKKH